MAAGGKYRVTAHSLNVRSQPRMADNVIGWLQKGDVVAHLGTSTDRVWLKVRRGDLEGWASQKHLTLVQPKEQMFRVAGAPELNVRTTPKIEPGNIVGTLKEGDVVKVSATSGDGRFLKVAKGTLKGWSSKRFLTLVHSDARANGDPAWLRVALAERGVKEKPGAADHPRIVEYLKSTNLGSPQNKNDETAWCSAFVNWCVEQAGFDGTDSALARDWLRWGKKIATPAKGCVAVFWRERKSGTKGHVGFYVGETPDTISLLGGNQNDRVSIVPQPKSRLLGFRAAGP